MKNCCWELPSTTMSIMIMIAVAPTNPWTCVLSRWISTFNIKTRLCSFLHGCSLFVHCCSWTFLQCIINWNIHFHIKFSVDLFVMHFPMTNVKLKNKIKINAKKNFENISNKKLGISGHRWHSNAIDLKLWEN